jgi:glycosyltransferase involved in cell wall biosynthesis
MLIGIDCRLSGPEHAGIGRYISELTVRLINNRTHNWVLFFSNLSQAENVLPKDAFKQSNVQIKFVQVKHYTLKEQILLPIVFNKFKLDLLHVPHFNIPIFYRGKIIVTIHDLLWHDQKGAKVTTLPAHLYWLKYFAYLMVARMAVNKSAKIIVPSKTIKGELIKHYPNAVKKIKVINEGFSQKLTPQSSDSEIVRKSNQLLFVGSLYPHKNVDLVIRALKEIPKFKLVIVGTRSIFMDQTRKLVQKMRVENQVEFKGRVSDAVLSEIYRESAALIQPSFSEGFGLTGLESLALKTPVLASDIPVFREIYKDAAIYFDPNSTKSLIRAIKALSIDPKNDFERKAKAVTELYSWSEMTSEILNTYQECHE